MKVDEKERREAITSAFLSIIHHCLHALQGKPININDLICVYELVISHFQTIDVPDSDGINVIEALTPFFHEDSRMLLDVWPYIEKALDNW